jgi:HD-like signal output (HDOD) protein
MRTPASDAFDNTNNCEFVHGLMERCLAREEIQVPLLPEVAMRVVRIGTSGESSAELLAGIITADPALAMYVLRVANSAGKGPAAGVSSMQQAVAWLGFDEVSSIAFTLALQGKMLDVPGQHHRARQLWRHALASALWSQQLAEMLARESGLCYLCGLLHNIGKPVALGTVHELARRVQAKLSQEEYEQLIATFHRPIAMRVVDAWRLPPVVKAAVAQWQEYRSAGDARFECNVVNVAQRLADGTVTDAAALTGDLVLVDAAFRDLGLGPENGVALSAAAPRVRAQVERYLAP